jgi:hypothetical protein
MTTAGTVVIDIAAAVAEDAAGNPNEAATIIDNEVTYASVVHTLTVNIVGGGTVDPAGGTYLDGEVVVLTATANTGWAFDEWSGDGTGDAPGTRSVTMDADKTVTATFVSTGGGGSPSGGGMVGVLAFGYIIDSQGRISKEARCISEGGEAYLLLPGGTYCLLDGFPLNFIYIQPDGEVNPPLPDYMILISRIFNLGPEGSTFNPPIKLIFNYNPALVPDDLDVLDLVIYRWSPGTGQWIPLETHVDPEKQIVWVEITGFSTYAVMLSARPADISVADLTVTPGEITEGEDATVDALLENEGDYSGTCEAALEINGAVAETKTVDVAKRGSATVSFDLTGLAAGTYSIEVGGESGTLTVAAVAPPPVEPTPADFTISSLEITPGEIDAGQNVDISVRVNNTGETEGVCQVVCKMNGSVVGEQQVTLAGGAGETVAFTLAVNEPGTKSIEVNELTGSLVVKEVPEDGGVAEVEPEETPEKTEEETSNWWIWVVVGIGVILIAGAAVLIIRRRTSE